MRRSDRATSGLSHRGAARTMGRMAAPTVDAVRAALARVMDPEIRRPITDLGMVRSVDVADDGGVSSASISPPPAAH